MGIKSAFVAVGTTIKEELTDKEKIQRNVGAIAIAAAGTVIGALILRKLGRR